MHSRQKHILMHYLAISESSHVCWILYSNQDLLYTHLEKHQVHSYGSNYETPRGVDHDGCFIRKLLSSSYWLQLAIRFWNRTTELPKQKTTGTITLRDLTGHNILTPDEDVRTDWLPLRRNLYNKIIPPLVPDIKSYINEDSRFYDYF